MTRSLVNRMVCLVLVGCLSLSGAVVPQRVSTAEDKAANDKAAKEQAAPAEKEATKPAKKKTSRRRNYHRLPPYYKHVVSDEQRTRIYDIQDEYGPQIKELQEKLALLKRERDEKIATVLTPEQLKKVVMLSAQAKAERRNAKKKAGQSESKTDT